MKAEDGMGVDLATRVRLVRRHLKISQVDLAEASLISRNTISAIEGGRNKDIKVTTLHVLSYWLGVPPHTWLLGNQDWIEWFAEWKKRTKNDIDSPLRTKV